MRAGHVIVIMLVALLGLAGGLSACASRDIPFATLEQKYGFAGSSYFEPQPGLRVHYLDEGPRDASALVMVHGFAASVHAWRPWAQSLRETYRVISLDLPGHGLTQTPEGYRASLDANLTLVDDLTRHLGVERFVLIGNSMGGAVAWNYALTHGDRLRGLVLINAAGWPGDDGERRSGPPAMFSLFNNAVGRGFLKLFDPRLFARSGLRSAYLDETLVDGALIDRYAELARAPGHRDVLLTQRSAPSTPRAAADFASILTPTLVMAGAQDKLIPAEQQQAIASAIPNAKLVIYADGGHVPMEQIPERSLADLRAFLDDMAN